MKTEVFHLLTYSCTSLYALDGLANVTSNQLYYAVLLENLKVTQQIKIFPTFHRTQIIITMSKEPATRPTLSYMSPVHMFTSYFLKTNFGIATILTSTPRAPTVFSFRLTHYNFVCILYIPCHLMHLDWTTTHIWWWVKIMKRLITQWSPDYCYSLSGLNIHTSDLISNIFNLWEWVTSFAPIQNNMKN
jgi:hypothetical protein